MDATPGQLPTPSFLQTPQSAGLLQHVFTWIVFASVCSAFILQHLQERSNKAKNTPPLQQTPSWELLIQARTIVGSKAWNNSVPGLSGIPKYFDDTIRHQVKNNVDRLCLVPLFAEIYDRERAVTELNSIALPINDPPAFHDIARGLRTIYESDGELKGTTATEIKKHLGWFGDLAISHSAGHSHEYRKIVTSSKWVALAQAVAGAAVGIAVIVGIGLIVVFALRLTSGRWRNQFDPTPEGCSKERVPFLELATIGIAAMLIVPAVCMIVIPKQLSFLAIVPVFAVFAWPLARRFDWARTRRILGFTSGRGLAREIGCGFIGYVAGVPLIALCSLLSRILAEYFHHDPSHPIVETIKNGGGVAIASTIVMACILIPILEEGIFRGALYGYFRRYTAALVSAMATGLIFAAIHPQGWTAIPTLCAIGFVFAMIREWRGSLIASVVAHSLNNSFALGMLCFLLLG